MLSPIFFCVKKLRNTRSELQGGHTRSVITGQVEGDSLFLFLILKNDAWIVSLKEKHFIH